MKITIRDKEYNIDKYVDEEDILNLMHVVYEDGQLEERTRIIRILQETLDENTYKRLQNKIYDSIVTD